MTFHFGSSDFGSWRAGAALLIPWLLSLAGTGCVGVTGEASLTHQSPCTRHVKSGRPSQNRGLAPSDPIDARGQQFGNEATASDVAAFPTGDHPASPDDARSETALLKRGRDAPGVVVRKFAHAVLFKPSGAKEMISPELAPLLVIEAANLDTNSHRSLAEFVEQCAISIVSVRSFEPTIDGFLRILSFEGEYSRVGAGGKTGFSIAYWLDLEGFPSLFLAKDSQSDRGMVFVSSSSESNMKQRISDPHFRSMLPTEPNRLDGYDWDKVGVLDDGPVPMGPYVYFDSAGRITTLRCRCSPSLVDTYLGSANFSLQESPEKAQVLPIPPAQRYPK